MKNNIYNTDELAIEMIATGSTIDDDPGYQGKIFEIRTWTFRMNHVGLDRWNLSDEVWWEERFFHDPEARAEYEAKKADHEQKRAALEAELREKLGADLTAGGFHVTQNLSEIFTAVQIIAVAGSEEDRPRKASVAERLHRSASMLNAMLCCMI